MTQDQRGRLGLWGGEAVNWLHGIAGSETFFGDKARLREIADNLFAVLKELKTPEREGANDGQCYGR